MAIEVQRGLHDICFTRPWRPWNSVNLDEPQLFTKVAETVGIFHRSQWNFNGLPLTAAVHGSPCEFRDTSWNFDFHGNSMEIHGHISMKIHRSPTNFMEVHELPWTSIDNTIFLWLRSRRIRACSYHRTRLFRPELTLYREYHVLHLAFHDVSSD